MTRPLVRLLWIARPFRWWMLLAALLGFATIGSSIGLMSVAAWIIASAALHPPLGELQLAIVGVRFFGIARGALRYAERIVSHQTTFRLLARLRAWFYAGIEPLAPARLGAHRSGDLLARAVADIETLQDFYLRVIASPAIAALTAAAMFGFFALYDLRLAQGLVGWLVVAGIGVPLLVERLNRRTGERLLTTRSALAQEALDLVQGMADLLAYGAAQRQLDRLRHLNRSLASLDQRQSRTGALTTALHSLAVSGALLTTLLIAVPLVRAGSLDGVMLAVLALATITAFEAVQPLPAAFQHLSANRLAARRLFELVDAPPAVTDPPAPVALPETRAGRDWSLRVEDLRFRYTPGDPPALDGVTFELPPGGTLALVGASGAGKSTLINLLLRFWGYDQGAIWLGARGSGEYDLRTLAAADARRLFAVVGQRAHLFNATLRENLRLAHPGAGEEALWDALRAAQVADFVAALPDGLDTWAGEGGLALSGGERQRIAIARAILKDAPFLLLDEPTAHLDPATGRAVLETIFTALADRTTLLITHDLASLEAAGQIAVLHAGRVVERGTHADLVQAGGHYRRLWQQRHQALRPAPATSDVQYM